MKKFFSKLTAALSAAVMIFIAVPIDTSAEQPYDSYNYDRWGDAIPSQAELLACGYGEMLLLWLCDALQSLIEQRWQKGVLSLY